MTLCLLLTTLVVYVRADHLIGGNITWTCQGGGDYVFQLSLIMDCNGVITPSPTEEIQVWNHSSVTSIIVNHIIDYDASPLCTSSGGNTPISCLSGGVGAYTVSKFISNPINLGGIPPSDGWIFTWDDFSRSAAIDNLNSPQTYGMTLISKMFNNSGMNGSPCYDSSPQFSDDLFALFCEGENTYNVKSADPDADSLVFSYTDPLTYMTATQPTFAQPSAAPYAAGYSLGSQLPNTSHNAANVPVNLNAETGEMSFTSYTLGVFVVGIRVESFRCGVKISQVNYELPFTVFNCGSANTAPAIVPPITNSIGVQVFEDTVFAGDVVNFSFVANDVEFLQDGVTPQQNTLTAFGAQFGANFTDPASGCTDPPCATLSGSLPISGTQGVNTVFNWQTDCAHVKNVSCSEYTTHEFHFMVQDDICPIPKFSTATVRITVKKLPDLPSPEARCADVQLDGSVDLHWEPITDTTGSFVEYRIYSSNGGPFLLEGVEPNIASGTFSDLTADAQNGSVSYTVRTVSGCNLGEALPFDTLNTMLLNVTNPGNGTALLTWNALINPVLPSTVDHYYIFREYPMGIWSLLDSVPIGNNLYRDTISVCNDSITYMIQAQDTLFCSSNSSLDGGVFQDQIPPSLPVIQSVSVDTSTNQAVVTWSLNPHEDTYGYIIFQQDNFGNWYILDTVWGHANTTYYNILSNAGSVSETYGVAAFDSCYSGTPPTPNTSPIGIEHNSILLNGSLDICAKAITLDWTDYINWPDQVDHYELYVSVDGTPATLLATFPTNVLSYEHTDLDTYSNYCYVVKAVSTTGKTALSNKECIVVVQPAAPNYLYTQAVSVESQLDVEVRILLDPGSSVKALEVERSVNSTGPWTYVSDLIPSTNPEIFSDIAAIPTERSYYYRVNAIDSCNRLALTSQISRTIYLTVTPDQARLVNLLQWNDYEGFDGAVLGYHIYRAVNGVFDPTPIATIGIGPRFYEDNVESYVGTNADGKFCYYVEAIENLNSFGLEERSKSNVACGVEEPLVFIPNAFIIGGVNSEFGPVVSYVDVNEYELNVYSRWGKLVFYSENVGETWDGRFNGRLCREDVYLYILSFKRGDGATQVHRGHVTLLKAE
jgi:gliding motility-associated-like protein